MEREWVAGGFQWAGIEHRGETEWPRLCSQSGAVDLFLQKKDAFYQNQSHWLDTPMIHLLPHWNYKGCEGEPIEVWAYTNCEEAELYLDGKSLGKRGVERYSNAKWAVPYKSDILTVIGRNGGTDAAKDCVQASRKTAASKLRLENTVYTANGRHVAIVTCYCKDLDGVFVPDAEGYIISFNSNSLGTVIGTGLEYQF